MGEWQPIDTVPLDGAVMVTDGLVFGAARRFFYIEPAELGYNNPPIFGGDTRRPNPKAGEVVYYWSAIAGWSTWEENVNWEQGEYENTMPRGIDPTYWMPLLPVPPPSASVRPSVE